MAHLCPRASGLPQQKKRINKLVLKKKTSVRLAALAANATEAPSPGVGVPCLVLAMLSYRLMRLCSPNGGGVLGGSVVVSQGTQRAAVKHERSATAASDCAARAPSSSRFATWGAHPPAPPLAVHPFHNVLFRISYFVFHTYTIQYSYTIRKGYDMARIGITFEQVAAAADKLAGEGRAPTIGAVREALGTGSPNTIHAHLKTWREARPVARAEVVELPADLRNAIANEMQKVASAARAEVQELLVQAQAEAAELAKAGDALEAERDELAEQVQSLTTERDQLAGKTEEQAAALLQAAERIEREQQAAEAARIELAKAQLKIEQGAVTEARAAAEIAELKASLKAAEKEAVEAAKAGAVSVAKLDSANAALKDMQARAERAEAATEAITKQAQAQATEARAALEKVKKELDALRSTHAAELKKANDQAAQNAERAARAEGKLAAVEEAAQKAQKAAQEAAKNQTKGQSKP